MIKETCKQYILHEKLFVFLCSDIQLIDIFHLSMKNNFLKTFCPVYVFFRSFYAALQIGLNFYMHCVKKKKFLTQSLIIHRITE